MPLSLPPPRPPRGFSLVELVIVIAILAVVSAIAIPRVSAMTDRYEASAAATNVAGVLGAIRDVARASAVSAVVRPEPGGAALIVTIADETAFIATVGALPAPAPDGPRGLHASGTLTDDARRAALLNLFRELGRLSAVTRGASGIRIPLPHGARITSADCGGDATLVFDAAGPDSPATFNLAVGDRTAIVKVDAVTGVTEVAHAR